MLTDKPWGIKECSTHKVVPSKGRMYNLFLPWRLEADVANSLVTVAVSKWPRPHWVFL